MAGIELAREEREEMSFTEADNTEGIQKEAGKITKEKWKLFIFIHYYNLKLNKCLNSIWLGFVIGYSTAPSVGEEAYCTEEQLGFCPSVSDMKLMDNKLQSIEEQLHYLLRKADELQNRLIYRCRLMHIYIQILTVKAWNSLFI